MSSAPGPRVPRVLLLVCDSWGIGGAPDAASYGDEGASTLEHTARAAGGLAAPNLEALGLGMLGEIEGLGAHADPGTAYGSAVERSAGKDSTTGHWEMMGIVLDRPFPLYPEGFPEEIVREFERRIGRGILGNVPASGTEIVARLGEKHLRTGEPIVYTSGDSVFQIACHKEVVPLETLYAWCEIARAILVGPHAVGRVIARPFEGRPGAFARSPERRDYSVPPPGPTDLERLEEAGVAVFAVGKIGDLFTGRGIRASRHSESNEDGVDLTLGLLSVPGPALVFTNLVEFDSVYGHRNDPDGYARAIEALDRRIPELLAALDGGVLLLTGDHGCDPTTPGTDHTRERTPLLAAGPWSEPRDIGVREGFSDIGATICELLGAPAGSVRRSFAPQLGIGSA